MDKKTKRQIMDSISRLNLSDAEVKLFIKSLGEEQRYLSSPYFEMFCVDCAIFYTNSVYTMSRWTSVPVSMYSDWSDNFIETIYEGEE